MNITRNRNSAGNYLQRSSLPASCPKLCLSLLVRDLFNLFLMVLTSRDPTTSSPESLFQSLTVLPVWKSCSSSSVFYPNFPCSVTLSLPILSSTDMKLEIAEPRKQNHDFSLPVETEISNTVVKVNLSSTDGPSLNISQIRKWFLVLSGNNIPKLSDPVSSLG